MVHTSKTQKKEIPLSPVRSRISAFASKFFDSRNEPKLENTRRESQITRRTALKSLATALGIGVVASCAPAAVLAEPKKPTQETAEIKKEVEYEVFTDPKELEPYFKNAEGKLVKLENKKAVQIGEYIVTAKFIAASKSYGVTFSIKSADGTYDEWGLAFSSPMNEVNVLAIDMGDSNPLIKGTMLVFADNSNVYFQFFDKMKNAHSLAGVPLRSGKMRRGPIRTGFELLEDGIDVFNAPEKLRDGDVVARASLLTNGDSGGMFFQYRGPEVDLVAMGPKTKTQF